MANLLERIIIVPAPASQLWHICLTDHNGKNFVTVYSIVFLTASKEFTTFHIIDNTKPDGTRRITTNHNIGYHIEELGKGFLRPNQSIVFNRLYLARITPNKDVHLHYPQQHPFIPITKTFRSSFYAQLNNPAL